MPAPAWPAAPLPVCLSMLPCWEKGFYPRATYWAGALCERHCSGRLASRVSLAAVLQGAQLIAVASADPTTGVVDGSPLQANDIQVQYVQLAPVSEASATAQAVEPLQSALQPEMHIEHESIQIQ
ncbi:hypothetical protein GDO81_015715 [Engystomops pustulosus]|uniref:Uncharacterized protein n=1 Tax=Engystomops pustulosus TaxID=76066 RepID=A0AAV7AMX1_ENGPU|nr:hypothetical protein GDO81_015715 [Engystomops pustulosus]